MVMSGQLALSKSSSSRSPCPGWSGALSCLLESSCCESFLLRWLDSILRQDMSKEIHFFLLELQLFRVQVDVVFASGLEHFAEGLVVLWFG